MDFPETPPQQGDMFDCDIPNWPIKDDVASMDFPLFTLAKRPDTTTREYRLGPKTIRVIPSVVGAATVYDKDLLLYVGSQIVEALKLEKPISRTVKVNTLDFLNKTERGDGGLSFERVLGMLRRLRGTTIETNIPTGAVQQTKGFSMIDDYEILSSKTRTIKKVNKKAKQDEEEEATAVYSFSVTISEWLYNSYVSFAVLSLDPSYFKISSPTDRRLYEILRKHMGDKAIWKINIDLLATKLVGNKKERFKMRELIREAILKDNFPQYRLALDPNRKPDMVVVLTRDLARLHTELAKDPDLYNWYRTLERYDNRETWQSEASRVKAFATKLPKPANVDD